MERRSTPPARSAAASAARLVFVTVGLLIGALFAIVAGTGAASAETLTSPSYRHVGGGPVSASAVSAGALSSTATSPSFGSLELSVGEAPTVQPSGSLSDLESVHPGFWARFLGKTAGGYASLDLDADLVAFFLDPDDDGDGLDDLVETATGVFVSALNTGSSPFLPDSDGDGVNDGVEVLAGFDPNDPLSRPAMQVPSVGFVSITLLVIALLLLGTRAAAFRSEASSC
ncbi:MAG: thrombospondin type 3 repeat-containing protein [Myxococcota bacterium]